MRRPQRPSRRLISTVGGILAVVLLVALARLLLSPERVEQRDPAAVGGLLAWLRTAILPGLTFAGAEAVANIAAFIPVGALAFVLLRERVRWMSLLVAPALSAFVEIYQAFFLPERVASVQDVALNALGGTIGVASAWALARLIPRRPSPGSGCSPDPAR